MSLTTVDQLVTYWQNKLAGHESFNQLLLYMRAFDIYAQPNPFQSYIHEELAGGSEWLRRFPPSPSTHVSVGDCAYRLHDAEGNLIPEMVAWVLFGEGQPVTPCEAVTSHQSEVPVLQTDIGGLPGTPGTFPIPAPPAPPGWVPTLPPGGTGGGGPVRTTGSCCVPGLVTAQGTQQGKCCGGCSCESEEDSYGWRLILEASL